jgi:predicted Ser/Thr protein kinase
MKTCTVCEQDFDDAILHCPHDGAKLISLPDPEPLDADPLVGKDFANRYHIEARIGVGGMGSVYRGRDKHLGRNVAIKVLLKDLRKDPEQIKRFFNEAKVVAKLRHPNTIQVFDFGESDDGSYYIAMEFMSGEQLDDHVAKHEMSLMRVIEIVEQVCLSLEEAHNAGIIHRDLKPDNVFIDTVDNKRIVKVIDFGIAKLMSGGENLTQAGMVFGTPAYMSPEQAKGETLDPRSDIYSLGVIIFFLLTGKPVFTGENPMEIAIKHITTQPPALAPLSKLGELPADLIALVESMLSKDRDVRPRTAGVVRTSLMDIKSNILSHGPSSSATAYIGTPGFRSGNSGQVAPTTGMIAPPRSRAPLFAGLAALLIAGGAGGSMLLLRADPPVPPIEPVNTDTAPEEPIPVADPAAVPAVLDIPSAVGRGQQGVRLALAEAGNSASSMRVSTPISSSPIGATIVRTDTGAELGTTPFTLVSSREGEPMALTLSLEGRVDSEAIVDRTGTAVQVSLPAPSRPTTTREPRREAPANTRRTEESDSEDRTRSRFSLRRPVTIVE